MEQINRNNKDRLFCFIFGRAENRKWTLSLYNAVNGTEYTDPDDVDITTMEDVIYMGMKNDVSFLICCDLNLYEQQSSYNPNMPVRQLMYLGRQYDKYIKRTKQNMYGRTQMTLPVPKLVTFYNGLENIPDKVLKLSDSFPIGSNPDDSDVEVVVHVYNIRLGNNEGWMSNCKPLAEYSWFVEEIRTNQRTMELMDAVDKAIQDMPNNYEIKEFLVEHQSEVKNMCLTEYNEAETMEMFKEEGREEGEENKLIRQVCRKLRKGKSVAEIAEDLEEDEAHIQSICDIAVEYEPDYLEESVISAIRQLELV